VSENGRSKLFTEPFGDIFDAADRARKEWDDRLILGVSDLRKRYGTYRLGLHVHIKVGQGDEGKLCVVFTALHDNKMNLDPLSARDLDPDVIGNDKASGDELVFIGNIDAVQHPQGVLVRVFGTFASAVRLDAFNDCCRAGGHSLYFSSALGYVRVRSVKDRKLPAPFGCVLSKKKCDVVKGGAQLVSDFTSEEHQWSRWLREGSGCFGEEPDPASSVVSLNSRGISASLEMRGPHLEVEEMLFGPFDLGADSI
jgi:hypothetical protein